VSDAAWSGLRARDRAIFENNWINSPEGIKRAFARVFQDDHNDA